MHNNTKGRFILLNSALFSLFTPAFAQTTAAHFKTDIDFGGGTVISTFLDMRTAENTFTITSPLNGDVRFVGSKARLGRMMGKLPKKGIIVTMKGEQQADSLIGKTAIPMFGVLNFKGLLKNGALTGNLVNAEGTVIGTIHGVSSTENKIDHSALYPQLIKTIQDNIYSKEALETKGWKNFDKKLEKLCRVSHDDIELFFGFSILAQKLPFTHLNLLIAESEENEEESGPPQMEGRGGQSVILEQKNDSTAFLQIRNFSSSADELNAILPQIVANTNYKHLVIDLRDNGGGGIDAAFALAKYIVTEDLEVGYFPTNKLAYSGFQPELFKTLPELQPKSTEEFGNELKVSPGVKLVFKKPSNPVFAGKLYVLTNGNTGSTCEPIVYALKNYKKATIIGENTYGGMLAASPFVVTGKFLLLLPIADFYTYDGVRLDKVGVAPDIEVKSEEALNKALEIIQRKKGE